MTEQLKKYIEFAIENGYEEIKSFSEIIDTTINYKVESKINGNLVYRNINLYELITSRPFIDAVASGIMKGEKFNTETETLLRINGRRIEQEKVTEKLIEEQALAIYNGTLEEFINNLLPKKDLGQNVVRVE